MKNKEFCAGAVVGAVASVLTAAALGVFAAAETQTDPQKNEDNPELAALYEADQADRKPGDGKEINWDLVRPRDQAREARVKELYQTGRLRTGKDYHRSAMVLQHAGTPEDYLLAHEFCIAALSFGERDARWLAAATEDRFLMNIDRPQRFGTQFRSSGPSQPFRLYKVDAGVTDALRPAMGVPTLEEARAREAEMNAK